MRLSDPRPLLALLSLAVYALFSNLHVTNFIGYYQNNEPDCDDEQRDYIAKTVNAGYEIRRQEPRLCEGYDGILFISHVIKTAGAGTLFFMSLVDAILYAEKYNLYPFLHVNDAKNRPCYDIKVHGIGPTITFNHLTGTIPNIMGKGKMTVSANECRRHEQGWQWVL